MLTHRIKTRALIGLAMSLSLLGCDATGPNDRQKDARLVFFGHPGDPLLVRSRLPGGATVEAYGRKRPDGSIEAMDYLVVSGASLSAARNSTGASFQRAPAPDTTTRGVISVDSLFRITKFVSPDASLLSLRWISRTRAIVSATSADGQERVTFNLDVPELAIVPARNLATRAGSSPDVAGAAAGIHLDVDVRQCGRSLGPEEVQYVSAWASANNQGRVLDMKFESRSSGGGVWTGFLDAADVEPNFEATLDRYKDFFDDYLVCDRLGAVKFALTQRFPRDPKKYGILILNELIESFVCDALFVPTAGIDQAILELDRWLNSGDRVTFDVTAKYRNGVIETRSLTSKVLAGASIVESVTFNNLDGRPSVSEATPSNFFPSPGQAYTVTIKVACVVTGDVLSTYVYGTDNYYQYKEFAIRNSDDTGPFRFMVPGAEGGVEDRIRLAIYQRGGETVQAPDLYVQFTGGSGASLSAEQRFRMQRTEQEKRPR